ncbi:putative nucleotidyltransferase with HDIG domain [Devosia sp. UYZn731]|uniref:HD-GYP domain-containing protein n=1 Tax=Devosia sp. UYZn731 TaxID=3156345 RepID=UPI0033958179
MLDLVPRQNGEEDAIPLRADRHGILLVSDRPDRSGDLAAILRATSQVTQIHLDDLAKQPSGYFRLFLDIDLADADAAVRLRSALDRSLGYKTPRYFVTTANHHTETQARALNAFGTVSRPFIPEQLLSALRCDSSATFQERLDAGLEPVCAGVAAAHSVLVQIFEGLPNGRPLTLDDVLAQENDIAEALRASGLKPWLDVVASHHNSSYRHCLSVTGFAVAFAQHLGFSVADQRRLARSSLLHDVGKAFIPIAILDKPGKLTDLEMSQMREHTQLGFEALHRQGGFPKEALDVVLCHHELLDGSGYPHGLRGAEISDTVRMVTIVDIYSALVEERTYRSGMRPPEAFSVLLAMGTKLDQHLVAAFRPIALGAH